MNYYLNKTGPIDTAAVIDQLVADWGKRTPLWQGCLHDYITRPFRFPGGVYRTAPGLMMRRMTSLEAKNLTVADITNVSSGVALIEPRIEPKQLYIAIHARFPSKGMNDPVPLPPCAAWLEVFQLRHFRTNGMDGQKLKPVVGVSLQAGEALKNYQKNSAWFRLQMQELFGRLGLDVRLDGECPLIKFVAGTGYLLEADSGKWDPDQRNWGPQTDAGMDQFFSVRTQFQHRAFSDIVSRLPRVLEVMAEEPLEISWDAFTSTDTGQDTPAYSDVESQARTNEALALLQSAQLPGKKLTLDATYSLTKLEGLDYLCQFLAPNTFQPTPLAEFTLPDRRRVLLQALSEAAGHQLAIRTKHELTPADVAFLGEKIGLSFASVPAKKVKGVLRTIE